jgi:hypothetical protein
MLKGTKMEWEQRKTEIYNEESDKKLIKMRERKTKMNKVWASNRLRVLREGGRK